MSWKITPQQKVPVDPLFGNVSLLLHGNGANGSTSIIDSSPSPKTVTANNGAAISTSQSKFGPSSIDFLSTANTSLSVSAGSAFQFGTDPWTVEAWIYQRTLAQYSCLLEIGNHGLAAGLLIATGSEGFLTYTGAAFYGNASGLLTNQWQHVAVSRDATRLRLFINGTLLSDVAFSVNISASTPVSVGYPLGIGTSSPSYRFNGFIDDLRITKGVARYQGSSFSVPTAPFPDI